VSVSARHLTRATAVLSACFSAALWIAATRFHSDLALAQASDSLLDVAGAVVLAWVVHVARAPGDERHPMGHSRAEPLGALGIAALAGVLALEVGISAVESLLGKGAMVPSMFLVGLFSAKILFKLVIWRLAARGKGPAFSALLVDARNDCLVGGLALIGFAGARLGTPTIDAWLALPSALWIGWSGVSLARENIDLLMGVAPEPDRQAALLAFAASVPQVVDAHDLVAHYLGTLLSVHVHISVKGELTVRQAHDIGEQVRHLLLEQEDVGHCSVHIDPAP
jgi:cation diffusion facilitator family transporter